MKNSNLKTILVSFTLVLLIVVMYFVGLINIPNYLNCISCCIFLSLENNIIKRTTKSWLFSTNFFLFMILLYI